MQTSIFQTGSSFFFLCIKAFPFRRKYSSTEYRFVLWCFFEHFKALSNSNPLFLSILFPYFLPIPLPLSRRKALPYRNNLSKIDFYFSHPLAYPMSSSSFQIHRDFPSSGTSFTSPNNLIEVNGVRPSDNHCPSGHLCSIGNTPNFRRTTSKNLDERDSVLSVISLRL